MKASMPEFYWVPQNRRVMTRCSVAALLAIFLAVIVAWVPFHSAKANEFRQIRGLSDHTSLQTLENRFSQRTNEDISPTRQQAGVRRAIEDHQTNSQSIGNDIAQEQQTDSRPIVTNEIENNFQQNRVISTNIDRFQKVSQDGGREPFCNRPESRFNDK